MFKSILTTFRSKHAYAIIAVIAAVFIFMAAGFIGTLAADSKDSPYSLSPLSYDINGRWDEEASTLQVTAEVTFTNNYPDSLSELVFHWHADTTSSLNTQPVQAQAVNQQWMNSLPESHATSESDWLGGVTTRHVTTKKGEQLEFNHQAQALTVQLPKTLKTGDTTTLKIRYDMEFPYGANAIMRSEALTGGTWWTPQLAVYDITFKGWNRLTYDPNYRSEFYQAADYLVKLELPASWKVITNGDYEKQTVHEDKQIITSYAHGVREMVWYGGNLDEASSVKLNNGLIVSLHRLNANAVRYDGLDTMTDSDRAYLLNQAANAVQWMTDKIGRLPYPEIKLVEAPYTGISNSMDGVVLFSRKADGTIDESSIYRSIAKQWMQHAVGSNPQQDGFLSDGLSEYLAKRYQEEVLQIPWSSPEMSMMVPQRLPAATNALKLKAEAELHYRLFGAQAIRSWVAQYGTGAIDQVFQDFYNTYKGKMASTKGFINIVRKAYGEEASKQLNKLLFNT